MFNRRAYRVLHSVWHFRAIDLYESAKILDNFLNTTDSISSLKKKNIYIIVGTILCQREENHFQSSVSFLIILYIIVLLICVSLFIVVDISTILLIDWKPICMACKWHGRYQFYCRPNIYKNSNRWSINDIYITKKTLLSAKQNWLMKIEVDKKI